MLMDSLEEKDSVLKSCNINKKTWAKRGLRALSLIIWSLQYAIQGTLFPSSRLQMIQAVDKRPWPKEMEVMKHETKYIKRPVFGMETGEEILIYNIYVKISNSSFTHTHTGLFQLLSQPENPRNLVWEDLSDSPKTPGSFWITEPHGTNWWKNMACHNGLLPGFKFQVQLTTVTETLSWWQDSNFPTHYSWGLDTSIQSPTDQLSPFATFASAFCLRTSQMVEVILIDYPCYSIPERLSAGKLTLRKLVFNGFHR